MGSRGRSLPRIKSGVGMTTQSTEGTLFRIPNPESRIPSLEVVAHVRPGASEEVALDVIYTRREQDRHARRIADELGDGADAQLARLGGDLEDTVLVGLVLRQFLDEAAVDLDHVRIARESCRAREGQ